MVIVGFEFDATEIKEHICMTSIIFNMFWGLLYDVLGYDFFLWGKRLPLFGGVMLMLVLIWQ